MTARLLRLLGALGLALAAGLAAPTLAPVPAAAAGCSGSGGVTVVVDYRSLGGGVEQGCAAGGGGTAYGLFTAVGTQIREASRDRGFVCRVNGVPASDPCVNASPANAYWGLFVSDGSGDGWVYAAAGVRSLQVPDGGMVAWSWQDGGGQVPPGVSARRTAPAPAPGGGSGGGSGGSGGGRGGGATAPDAPTDSPTDTPTAAPDDEAPTGQDAGRERGEERGDRGDRADRRGEGDRPRRQAGDQAEDAQQESSSSSLSDADGETRADDAAATGATGDPSAPDGPPLWVPLLVVGLLGAGGVGAVLWRRRTTGSA